MTLHLECDADEQVALSLGVTRRAISHQGGRGEVCNKLKKGKDLLGMVDEDPQARPTEYMRTLPAQSFEHGVRVLTDTQRNNRLLILCPKLENWLVKAAHDAALRLSEFGLPDNAHALHGVSNFRLRNIDQLVRRLLAVKSPRVLHLQALLKEA